MLRASILPFENSSNLLKVALFTSDERFHTVKQLYGPLDNFWYCICKVKVTLMQQLAGEMSLCRVGTILARLHSLCLALYDILLSIVTPKLVVD